MDGLCSPTSFSMSGRISGVVTASSTPSIRRTVSSPWSIREKFIGHLSYVLSDHIFRHRQNVGTSAFVRHLVHALANDEDAEPGLGQRIEVRNRHRIDVEGLAVVDEADG